MFADHPTTETIGHRTLRRALLWAILLIALITAISLFVPRLLSAMPYLDTSTSAAPTNVGTAEPFPITEPIRLDHSILNNASLPPEPNPAPMSVAAYD